MDYLLFTHFTVGKTADVGKFHRRESLDGSLGRRVLERFLPDLEELLTGKTGRRGVLLLFYDAGWGAYLEELECAFYTEHQRLDWEFGSEMCKNLKNLTSNRTSSSCIRIVGAREVFEFFAEASGQAARDMFKWFMGRNRDLLYDAPKVVDAILRIRAMEHPVPVFRMDQDVLFPVAVDEAKDSFEELHVDQQHQDWLQRLGEALDRSLALYRQLNENADVGRSIFSCQYVNPPENGSDPLVEWGRGFATRIDPVRKVGEPARLRSAEQFFGIQWDSEASGWQLNNNRMALTAVGGHPLRAPISGALMYLSAGLLVDLPPVSVVRRPVLWIDDHLRWELHKALGHLESMPFDPWARARDGVRPAVTKWRKVQKDIAYYDVGAHPMAASGRLRNGSSGRNQIWRGGTAEEFC